MQADLLYRQLSKENGTCPKKYSPQLKAFALTLHYYSPKAYRYVRKKFKTCLPHPKTLYRWLLNVDGNPGFTKESFLALKKKCEQFKDREIVFALVIDEMSIRRRVEYCNGKYYGYVNFGVDSQLGTENGTCEVAKESLTFLLVAINANFKAPCAYFLTSGTNGGQKAELIRQCLKHCCDFNLKVVSLTFDGAANNYSMCEKLGAKLQDPENLQPYFLHPVLETPVHIFPDPCHNINLVRNTFGDFKKIYYEGEEISWHYIEELHKLQENETLHLANKLTQAHISYCKQIMKVKLATQLCSNSNADALEMCMEMDIPQFKGCRPTTFFLRMFNNIFDIFNSRNQRQLGFKKPISKRNSREILEYLAYAEKIIRKLSFDKEGKDLIIKSRRKTGFLNFLIDIESFRNLFDDLCVKRNVLCYLPCYKLSQDHVELFFSKIRARGGFNNNPTARQFLTAYKANLVHMELSEDRTGNCLPLEDISVITNTSSVNIINQTSQELCDSRTDKKNPIKDEYCLPETELSFEKKVEINIRSQLTMYDDHAYVESPQELTEVSQKIIPYICGFVVRSLHKTIKCVECLMALITFPTKVSPTMTLIEKKDNGGLIYPSKDVIYVAKITEKIIRLALAESGGKYLKPYYTTERLRTIALKNFINVDIFTSLKHHSHDQDPLLNHRLHITKSIIEVYLKIRINYICKKAAATPSFRQHNTKMVLFAGK